LLYLKDPTFLSDTKPHRFYTESIEVSPMKLTDENHSINRLSTPIPSAKSIRDSRKCDSPFYCSRKSVSPQLPPPLHISFPLEKEYQKQKGCCACIVS
jgi:hypothetical protein